MWSAAASQRQTFVSVVVAGAAGATFGGAAAWYNNNSISFLEEAATSTGSTENDHDTSRKTTTSNPIEINLMDKIANKIYLQPSRVHYGFYGGGGGNHHHHNTNSDYGGIMTTTTTTTKPRATFITSSSSTTRGVVERPIGVPSKLRILAIDLPEMREQAFTRGECRIAFDKVYPDGIAPPKKVELQQHGEEDHNEQQQQQQHDKNKKKKKKEKKKNSKPQQRHNNATTTLEVEQKAWVRSMVRCMQGDLPNKVGVEMMEASFSELNPKNYRKTRQVGGHHYDPGKYTNNNNNNNGSSKDYDDDDDHHHHHHHQSSQSQSKQQSIVVEEHHQFQYDDELDAPWNQYAWIEELQLRITGQVPFGDALEPASRWNQIYTGNHYKATVPSQRKWFLPSFLQSDPEGIDGTDNYNTTTTTTSSSGNRGRTNWASNKPHAVIANGAAVQRMPSGLRLLQTVCRDANVPLFVLYDPRAWGANTHQSLQQALRDARRVVKQNVVINALENQSGFSRGRRVGRVERSIEQWVIQAKQDRQRRQEAFEKRQWQKLDAVDLEKRLIEYGVLRREDRVEDGKIYRHYSPAMVEIARQCMEDTQQQQQQQEAERKDEAVHPPSQDDGDDDSSVGRQASSFNNGSKAHL